MTSTLIKIDISAANATLPAALEARLTGNGTPTKSPEALSEELRAHAERTAALRAAHLDNVRATAERANQRAKEACARKLRAAAAAKSNLLAKMDAAASKTSAKRQAAEHEREVRKATAEARKAAVIEARKAMAEAKLLRQAALAEAEKVAATKHAKAVDDVMSKGANVVKHALAVAHAHKAALETGAIERGDRLAARLAAAEVRRDILSSPEHSSAASSAARLHRVKNESKVEGEMRKLSLESSLAKAASKRQAHIEAVASKAKAEVDKVAAVSAKAKGLEQGTDPHVAHRRHALYEKQVNAGVRARQALVKRAHRASKGDTVSVIVVKMDDVVTPRAPPPALIKRLAAAPKTLLLTAAARQAGAKARRAMLAHFAALKAARANERRAAAAGRRSKTAASRAALVEAKSARALVCRALQQGKLAHGLSRGRARIAAAALRRAQLASGVERVGAIRAAKGEAAAERKAKALRAVGKTGVVAVRAAAAHSRIAARRSAVVSRGEALAARCEAAAAKKAEVLAQKVALARKRMVAAHPKREVADMEVKAAFSDA